MHSRDKFLQAATKADFQKHIIRSSGDHGHTTGTNPGPPPTENDPNTDDSHSTPPHTAPPVIPSNNSTQSLMMLTNGMIQNLTMDINKDGVYDSHQDPDTGFPVSLESLFNFNSLSWSSDKRYNALQSLDEELKFYQLLELDAIGEEDIDHNLEAIVELVILEGWFAFAPTQIAGMQTNLLIQTIPSKLLHHSILRALFLLPCCMTLGHGQRRAIVEDSRSKPAGMCVWPHSKWSIKQFLKGLHDKTLAASKNPRLRNG
ncbi:hypothetical protein P691DRAFT_767649 [Macrolepiota fuliginosa MF-IS2]|uniref:Uncharacterized protein n=1 Tax=Macrolepiota fuliginosa MF-IS2 TaxID=1400762 RepID=A0A9P5WY68_9AGAR|nr:hypothetical protein P691DRAFT_767649 [Macrolepiota fuliginosa MF-IS2]